MSDDELADAWEAGALGRPIGHLEHVRIAAALVGRHSAEEAERRLVEGTLLNCKLLDAADRFDEELTRRWARLIASAATDVGTSDADELIRARPDLSRGDLLGPPAWKRREESAADRP